MIRSFRFLLQFAWINLACLAGFAVLVTAGAYATGVPSGAENLFKTYFGTFPLMALIIVLIFAFALCSSNLNLALSFGARRRDFFLSLQGILLLYAGACWAMQTVMCAIPIQLGWSDPEGWSFMMTLGTSAKPWLYPMICLTILALGCLGGLVITKSRIWGSIIITACMLVAMAGVVLLMLSANTDLIPHAQTPFWGRLPLYLTLGMLAVLAISEAVIWRTVRRFTVK